MPDRVAAESVIEITWNTQEPFNRSWTLPRSAFSVRIDVVALGDVVPDVV